MSSTERTVNEELERILIASRGILDVNAFHCAIG